MRRGKAYQVVMIGKPSLKNVRFPNREYLPLVAIYIGSQLYMLQTDKYTSVSIQLKHPQFRHSRESGNPEIIVIIKIGFPPSRE